MNVVIQEASRSGMAFHVEDRIIVASHRTARAA